MQHARERLRVLSTFWLRELKRWVLLGRRCCKKLILEGILEGCLTVHRYREIKWNANLMQLGNFIDVFLARHVSGTYAHHQEHYMLSCSIWFSEPSFWMGGSLESRCVGRVCGADGAVRHARHHPHRTHDLHSSSQDHHPSKNFGAENHMLQLNI